MNKILTLPKVVELLSQTASLQGADAERWILEFTTLVTEALASDGSVRIKGLGTFTRVDAGGRVSVQFAPDRELAEYINAPFECFKPEAVADGLSIDMLESQVDVSINSVPVDKSTIAEAEETQEPEEAPDSEETPAIEEAEDTQATEDTQEPAEEPEAEEPEESKGPEEAPDAEEPEESKGPEEAPDAEEPEESKEPEEAPEAEEPEESKGAEEAPEAEEPEESKGAEEAPEAEEPEESKEPEESASTEQITTQPMPLQQHGMQVEPPTPAVPPVFASIDEEPESRPNPWFWLSVTFILGILIGFGVGYFCHDPIAARTYSAAQQTLAEMHTDDSEQPDEIDISPEATEAEAAEEQSTPEQNTQGPDTEQPTADTPDTAPTAPTAVPEAVATNDGIVYDYVNRSLTGLARKHYGNDAYWVYIYKENQIKDPRSVFKGQKVIIPPKSKYDTYADEDKNIEAAKLEAEKIYQRYGR